jgi:luciferase family oxidoreductase group 1
MKLQLSALDQSVGVVGRAQDSIIRQTVELATHCEALGYQRFWVSEHHSHPGIIGTAPEILMAAIAMRTTRIRIGSAGVMLPHYSALKVAEQFRVLDALAPGRIDLGLGRAPGSDRKTAQLLNPNQFASDQFPQQILELKAWLTGTPFPSGHPAHGVFAYPQAPTCPEIWILGSSDYGAQLAAHFGLPYAFAHFITDGQGMDQAMGLYHEGFKPSTPLTKPHATMCVWAMVAPTRSEALMQFGSRARFKIDRNYGAIAPLMSPEAAMNSFKPEERGALEQLSQKAIVGDPKEVGDRLRALAERFDLDEIVVITWAHDPQVQKDSYALLAQELGLS